MSRKDLRVEEVQDLVDKGKKKGSLTYTEIMDALQDVELSTEQIDELYEALAEMGRRGCR